MAIDIVCGKEVRPDDVNATVGMTVSGATDTNPIAGTKRFYEGVWYYFCSLRCRQRFMAMPDEYIAQA